MVSLAVLADSQARSKAELRVQRPAWTKVSTTLAVLKDSHGAGLGFAVLIGKDGTFIASRNAVQSKTMDATISGPTQVKLQVVAEDPVTNLALLKAENWDGDGRAPASVVDHEVGPDEILLAASASGPVTGQMTNNRRPGVLANSQFVPLYEMRLESTAELIGGAVVFTQSGELVGVLSATQGAPTVQFGVGLGPRGGGGFGGAGAPPAAKTSAPTPGRPLTVSPEAYQKLLQNFGPQGLTVGYVLGPKVLKRVITGLSSDDHLVKHPYIGVEFREVVKGKVTLTLVKPDGGAARAGLASGDTVLKVGDVPVQSGAHFASMLFEQEPGSTMRLTLKRGTMVKSVDVVVGVQPAGR
ncbi:MAG: PDZ domain-containing protein [Fimbriimonadaceae bacterium]|nr:PDZ domain-containing protein [Fimbriimonadaceae bacterium]